MDRETAATYLTKGNRLKRAGKLKEAIASYRRAIEINPHLAWSHHNLGEALAKRGLLDEAIAAYKLAIELNPKSAWSYYELGEVFATKGEWDAAVPNYRRACELEPDFEGFSRGLEKAVGKLGDRPQFPDKGRAFFQEAKTHFANRLWEETITSCRQAIEGGVEDFECYKILAFSLKKRHRWKEAIAAYYKVIELNPTDSQGYYLLGDIFRIQGKLEEQIAVYQKGLKKLPENEKLAAKLQQSIEENKQQTRPHRGSQVKEDIFQLGMQLVESKKIDEAILYYEKILQLQPLVGRQLKQSFRFGIVLVQAGEIERVIETYQKVFLKKIENLDIYYQLVIRLANKGLIAEAVKFFQELPKPQFSRRLEPLIDSSNSSNYDAIWNWFNQSQYSKFNLDEDLDKLELEAEEIQQHFHNQTLKIITLTQATPEDKTLLEKWGISLEYTRLMKMDSNGLENIYINCFNDDLSSTRSRTELYPHKNFNCWHVINNPVEFPQTIAEFNYLYALDPMTGQVLRSNESFFMGDALIFYRFVGREVFYIGVGNFTGEKVSVYFPKFKLAISYDIHHSSPNIYHNLAAYIVTYFRDASEYLKKGDRRKLTSLIGFVKNLGHYFWQDLNGIYYLGKNRLWEKIDYVAVGPYEPLEFTSAFPDIPANKIFKIEEMSGAEVFRFFLNNNSLCFRITDHYMTNDYIENIRRVARDKCSKEFTQKLSRIKENPQIYPLIWINLRNHNKSWVSQVKGSANIINKLKEDYPNIGIVFDGWIDCQDIVKKIINRLNPEIKVYNTLGCPLHESIVWGNAIDAYIAIVGSGLVITSWLNDKPGVAYSNRGHLKQKNFWSKVKEKAIEPDFLDFDDVTNVGTGGWCNYQLDWQVIYNKMFNILQSIK